MLNSKMNLGTTTSSVMAFASILNFFMPVSMAIDGNCDYYQNVLLGQQFYIYNSEYPDLYERSVSCRWTAQSPPGSKIFMTCEKIQIPDSSDCRGDHLAVSLTGKTDFSDARNYCGTGTLSVVSEGNALAVGLFSTWNSEGGKFVCALTAVQDTNPTTTTPRPSTCDCGWSQGLRITGGHETGVNQYPYMSGLIDFLNREVRCGASIISEIYAVTAAHCLEQRDASELGLLVGDHNISSGLDTPYSRLLRIRTMLQHPQFDLDTLAYDIALLQTAEKIQFSLYVGPVCLPFRYSNADFVGEKVKALGWGLLEYTGRPSDVLQEVDLNVVPVSECAREITDRPVTDRHLCTYAKGKDACQFDSGGPLLWYNTNTHRYMLVALISFGKGCGLEVPSVNTKLSPYLSWIVSQTSDASYCIK